MVWLPIVANLCWVIEMFSILEILMGLPSIPGCGCAWENKTKDKKETIKQLRNGWSIYVPKKIVSPQCGQASLFCIAPVLQEFLGHDDHTVVTLEDVV